MSSSPRKRFRLVRAVLDAAPVWIPTALCVQVVMMGLLPALREQRRLERASVDLEARHEQLAEEREQLDRVLRAHSDPLFVERERRALRAAPAPAPSNTANSANPALPTTPDPADPFDPSDLIGR